MVCCRLVVKKNNFQTPECIKRVEKITGRKIIFNGIDLMEKEELHKIFQQYHFLAVFHFAGLKSVTESIQQPIQYYEINLGSQHYFITYLKVKRFF